MIQVYVGVGSNIDREWHIRSAINVLRQKFDQLRLSTVYESEPVGFRGNNFFNLVIGFSTAMSLSALTDCLRQVEFKYGRPLGKMVPGDRHLDLDILTYGDLHGEFFGIEFPRSEITENAYVLCPLAELAATTKHPGSGKTYSSLWNEFDQQDQKLWPADFIWEQPR